MNKSMNKGLIDHFLPGEIMRFRNLSQYYSSPLAIGIAIAASILYWSYEDRLNEQGWMRRMTIRDKWCCLSPSRSRYFHWMASLVSPLFRNLWANSGQKQLSERSSSWARAWRSSWYGLLDLPLLLFFLCAMKWRTNSRQEEVNMEINQEHERLKEKVNMDINKSRGSKLIE